MTHDEEHEAFHQMLIGMQEAVDKAVGEVLEKQAAFMNSTCDCGATHEIAAGHWLIAVEFVDMSARGLLSTDPIVLSSGHSMAADRGLALSALDRLRGLGEVHVDAEGY